MNSDKENKVNNMIEQKEESFVPSNWDEIAELRI